MLNNFTCCDLQKSFTYLDRNAATCMFILVSSVPITLVLMSLKYPR
jgi:hypothetical protein